MKRLLIAALLLGASSALAETEKPVLDAATCAALMTEHVPDDDVTYKPGVDVSGKPVVAADLAPSVVRMPDEMSFDLTVDAAAYAGIAVPPGVEMKGGIGRMTVRGNRVFFNGEDIGGPAAEALRALCPPKAPLQKDKNTLYND